MIYIAKFYIDYRGKLIRVILPLIRFVYEEILITVSYLKFWDSIISKLAITNFKKVIEMTYFYVLCVIHFLFPFILLGCIYIVAFTKGLTIYQNIPYMNSPPLSFSFIPPLHIPTTLSTDPIWDEGKCTFSSFTKLRSVIKKILPKLNRYTHYYFKYSTTLQSTMN
jgi:hypothetical protein